MQHGFDPYKVLGVPRGATEDAIKAAYRERAKRCHPDRNSTGSSDEFIRVQAAFEWFERRGFRSDPAEAGGPSLHPMGSPFEHAFNGGKQAPKGSADVIRIVRDFMQDRGLEVRFDGELVQTDALLMAHSPAEIDRVLGQDDWDADAFVDALVIHTHEQRMNVPVGLLQRAVRQIMREDQRQRVATVMGPLLVPPSSEEQARADEQWQRFVETAFEMPTGLGIAILQKFVHQVKTKCLKRPVKRHLMPVVQGNEQGGGKTTTTLKFLTPLKELRTEPALLSDFVDKRSGDIYRYLAVLFDDLHELSPDDIPTLNSLVTGGGLMRRKMGGSGSRKIKQLSTLIGNCNRIIPELIPDETGNRRFAPMPFRNGEVLKGGDPKVWKAVNETDFDLLWRSVDVFGDDPIEAVLSDLFAWQERFRRLSPLEAWLVNLDTSSDEVRAISDHNGTRARELWHLFRAQTGSAMTEPKFSAEMARMIELGRGPFGPKVRPEAGVFYPRRAVMTSAL
jgi:hypothetical protein